MESDDLDTFQHLAPTLPPPLSGPGDFPLPLIRRSPHLALTRHTHILSPTPRHALPSRALTTTFVINQYYLSLLSSIAPNKPLPIEPLIRPAFRPRSEATATARPELIHEEQCRPSAIVVDSPPPPGQNPVAGLAQAVSGNALLLVRQISAASSMTPIDEGEVPEKGDATESPEQPTFSAPLSSEIDDALMDVEPYAPAFIPPTRQPQLPHDTDSWVPSSDAVSESLNPTPASPPDETPPFELPPPSPEPAPTPPAVEAPTPPKRQAMRGLIRAPEQVTAEEAQWRTGKSPGYQGLTQKRKASALCDEEDEPPSIAQTAHRVLKRPFKPLTIAKKPMVRLKPRGDKELAKPRAAPTRRLGTSLRAKPFRPPSAAVGGSSPLARSASSGRSKSGRSGKAMDLNLQLIASLETRLRTLRQAIKYDDPEEDSRVIGLIHTWREAGREVADRLFALLPTPSDDSEPALRSARWDDWGYADNHESFGFSKEQLEYLRHAPTDAQGDVLDEAGNPVFGDEGDLGSLIDQAMGAASDYVIPHESYGGNEETKTQSDRVWDKGAMLLCFGVDPDLLGWDREGEDWAEVVDG